MNRDRDDLSYCQRCAGDPDPGRLLSHTCGCTCEHDPDAADHDDDCPTRHRPTLGYWTPWAEVLCGHCHKAALAAPQGRPVRDVGPVQAAPSPLPAGLLPALCDACGRPCAVDRDVAAAQALARRTGGRLDQLGGMTVGVRWAHATGGYLLATVSDESPRHRTLWDVGDYLSDEDEGLIAAQGLSTAEAVRAATLAVGAHPAVRKARRFVAEVEADLRAHPWPALRCDVADALLAAIDRALDGEAAEYAALSRDDAAWLIAQVADHVRVNWEAAQVCADCGRSTEDRDGHTCGVES